jgi:hypothetical protein
MNSGHYHSMNRNWFRVLVSILVLLFLIILLTNKSKTIPFGDAANRALAQSLLTLPGSPAFHLKVVVSEPKEPYSDYKAEIEEYWVSPEKWRRVIHSSDYSQTVVVNGDKAFVQDDDDYFPVWLQNVITALFNPIPNLQELKQRNLKVPLPGLWESLLPCVNVRAKIGVPPVQAPAFSVVCFREPAGLLDDIVTPEYSAEFSDYQNFLGKQVPHRMTFDPEPGRTIEARIAELTPLEKGSPSLFEVSESTPGKDILPGIFVKQAELMALSVRTPAVAWPTTRKKPASGVIAIFVSIDREGHVQETYPLYSDNSDMAEAAQRQVAKWRFKPVIAGGIPVQAKSLLALSFNTKIENPVTVLSDAEMRKLAIKIVEPTAQQCLAPSGATYTLTVSLGRQGELLGYIVPAGLSPRLQIATHRIIEAWQFKPYMRDGSPDVVNGNITFHIPAPQGIRYAVCEVVDHLTPPYDVRPGSGYIVSE